MIITLLNDRLKESKKELAKLTRKAIRAGNLEIQVRTGATRFEVREFESWDGGSHKVTVSVNDIEIEGLTFKVGDYTFIARIEHTEAGNLLMLVPECGVSLDARWWEAYCSCDHCHRKRRRSDTFVLLNNATGAQIQVGRTCLQDFLGIDPAATLRKFEVFKRVREILEDNTYVWCCDIKSILEIASTVIRLYGWCPKAQETETTLSTASEVGIVLSNSPSKEKRRKQLLDSMLDIDRTLAQETLEWVRNQLKPTSEYEHNLKTLLSRDVLTEQRFLGFVVSAVSAYCRHKQRQIEYARKRAADATSTWVGLKGERLRGVKVQLTMSRLITSDSYYGSSILYKFKTAEGSILTWMTGNSLEQHQGDEFSIDATVRDHNEWNGIKETRVTRVRVL